MLDAFDAPRMEPNCSRRVVSTVAPQSLAMLNGDFVLQQAGALADRVAAESTAESISQLWRLVYGRAPTVTELQSAERFVAGSSARLWRPQGRRCQAGRPRIARAGVAELKRVSLRGLIACTTTTSQHAATCSHKARSVSRRLDCRRCSAIRSTPIPRSRRSSRCGTTCCQNALRASRRPML